MVIECAVINLKYIKDLKMQVILVDSKIVYKGA